MPRTFYLNSLHQIGLILPNCWWYYQLQFCIHPPSTFFSLFTRSLLSKVVRTKETSIHNLVTITNILTLNIYNLNTKHWTTSEFCQNYSLCFCHQMVLKSFLSCRDHLSLGNPERHEEPEGKANYLNTFIIRALIHIYSILKNIISLNLSR